MRVLSDANDENVNAAGGLSDLLLSALNSLSANIALLDSDGVIMAVNDAWREFAADNQYSNSSYGVGLNYLAMCDNAVGEWAGDARRTAAGIRAVIAGEQNEFYLEYPCHSPDRMRWFTMRATRFEWAGSARAIVAHQDVTVLKETTLRLNETERHMKTIVDHVVDGILTLDEAGVIQAINPAGAQIFGYQAAEIVGQPIHVLALDGQRQRHPLNNLAVYADRQRLELTGLRHDGSTFPMDLAVSAIPLDGRCMYTAIIQDLTDRKLAEAERVEKERLHVALDKEKELRALKSRFVSMISHEIRAPLSAIMLAGDMLTKFGDLAPPEERADYLDTIKTQSEHLADLVNDVLRLSKIESTGPDFKPETVSVEVICRTIIDELDQRYQDRDIVFVSKQRPIHADIDTKLLRHALSNLLTNAIKYSPEGSEVRLELSRKRGQVFINVMDRGIGIPEEDLAQLFEPFHRATNAEDITGTGLGLYIAKQAVELHQGAIAVESKVGRGTTFTITLPMMQQEH
jgi:PAS domain S-box-containing protein